MSSTTKALQRSGALDKFESFQLTPCIGTEFVGVDLAEWITGPESDAKLRDLAITGTQPHPKTSITRFHADQDRSGGARCRFLSRPEWRYRRASEAADATHGATLRETSRSWLVQAYSASHSWRRPGNGEAGPWTTASTACTSGSHHAKADKHERMAQ
jgi:hypothetical protein